MLRDLGAGLARNAPPACPTCAGSGFYFRGDGPAAMRWTRCGCSAGASWLSYGLEGTLVNAEDWEAVFSK